MPATPFSTSWRLLSVGSHTMRAPSSSATSTAAGFTPPISRSQQIPPNTEMRSPTSRWTAHASEVGDRISVFGGICCDREIGGVNPAAVEVALELGARIVWLPTLSSRQDVENGVAGIPGPGLVVTGAEDTLLPETREVLTLVRAHDAVLATGHVSAAEHYAVVKE